MIRSEEKGTRERILEVARHLFARKGYAATGLREIVREAGVSVAMVNYHFGSKQALMKEITGQLFENIYSIAEETLSGEVVPEVVIRRYLRRVIDFFRQHPDLVRIGVLEFPHDAPEFVDFKAERISRLAGLVLGRILPALPADVRQRVRPEVIGPALVGMLAFHFIMRPVVEAAFHLRFDEGFYAGYADQIADLFLYGVLGERDDNQSTGKDG